ncbi:hypothetical protein AWC38_SpisGene12404 [Stylophora pistillata]|uniref:ShKT domain-containing protein n=1 Tax=Stylophora pistillata TaxID=50429 RepID=A0A2B4S3C4_STYPI|nr:hypothetical protein AWC38_SpisGene12404 [Stylophora pistillata]
MNSWWILIISLGMLAVQNLLVDAGPVDMRMFPREQEEYERSWLEEKRGLCHDMKPIKCIWEQNLCNHLNHANYQDFLAFAYVECPQTCRMC